MLKDGTRLTYGGLSFSMECSFSSFLSSNFIYRLLRNGKAFSVRVMLFKIISRLIAIL